MERAMWFSRLFTFIKILVILGFTLGAYYYVQPYIDTLLSIYGSFGDSVRNINSIGEGFRNFQGQ